MNFFATGTRAQSRRYHHETLRNGTRDAQSSLARVFANPCQRAQQCTASATAGRVLRTNTRALHCSVDAVTKHRRANQFLHTKSRLHARTRGDLDIRLTQLIVTVTHDEVAKVDADKDVVAVGLKSDYRDIRNKLLVAVQQATVFGQLAPSNKKDFPSRLGHVRAHLESWRGQLALWAFQVH